MHTKDIPWMCNEVRYFILKRDRCFNRFKRTLSAQDPLIFTLPVEKQTGLSGMLKTLSIKDCRLSK